jgi:two-component system, NtrC family, response regulator AtoC
MDQTPRSSVHETPMLLGYDATVVALRSHIAAAARSHAKVLILGETGVGKELVAKLIHEQSSRRDGPYVVVNCSGIPESLLESELFGHVRGSFTGAYADRRGLIRQANGGTLFLDELGEMSLRMQAMLLRFAETGEVQQIGGPTGHADVRLITATNRDLRAAVTAGTFREDLYYRLNVLPIEVPPLRARGADILLLANHYLELAAVAHGQRTPVLTSETAQVLAAYQWPGNVRELRNMTERLTVSDHQRPVTPDDLPLEVRSSVAAPSAQQGIPVMENVQGFNRTELQPSPAAQDAWDRMHAGEDFWAVVVASFNAHDLTRSDLATVIDRGLRETRGSYRGLLHVFHLPSGDYKRFHAFLYKHHCNLPFAPYRNGSNDCSETSMEHTGDAVGRSLTNSH